VATRLAHFGRYLHDLDPDLASFADLDQALQALLLMARSVEASEADPGHVPRGR